MKHLIITFLLIALSINTLSAQSLTTAQIKTFVEGNIKTFPESTLQDLYKSFFQSVYGPEHLVTDSAKVLGYIDHELQQEFNNSYPEVQYLGVDSTFVRVNLSVIKNGKVSKQLLAGCFMRSSQYKSGTDIESFRAQWRQVTGYIAANGIRLNNFANDSLYIENILAQGRYVWVHSPQYKAAYKPHYRIVSTQIYNAELLPLIKPTTSRRTRK